MTALGDQLQDDLKDAMRAKDDTRKGALRMLMAAIKNADIAVKGSLDDAGAVVVLQKEAKLRRESLEEFKNGGREDLAAKEAAALEVLAVYLPEAVPEEEIEAAAVKVIAETGASGQSDLGKVMPVLVKEFAGRADGRAINTVVRRLLSD